MNGGAVQMKISQEMRSQTVNQLRSSAEGNKSFQHIVQSQTHHLKQQEVKQLMNQIVEQGEKLSRFRSFPDLVKFKRLVKGFLEKTVYNGLDLQKSHNFNLEGQNHQLSIVKEVDEKLIELTEELMSQESKAVDLLGIIGEIKGLLVNLYT